MHNYVVALKKRAYDEYFFEDIKNLDFKNGILFAKHFFIVFCFSFYDRI